MVTAILGSVGGSLLAGGLGSVVGGWYVDQYMPIAELDGVIPPALGLLGGAWCGAVLGCWLALRSRRTATATRVATILGALFPVGVAIWIAVRANYPRGGALAGDDWLLAHYGSGLGVIGGLTVLACWLTFRNRRDGGGHA